MRRRHLEAEITQPADLLARRLDRRPVHVESDELRARKGLRHQHRVEAPLAASHIGDTSTARFQAIHHAVECRRAIHRAGVRDSRS